MKKIACLRIFDILNTYSIRSKLWFSKSISIEIFKLLSYYIFSWSNWFEVKLLIIFTTIIHLSPLHTNWQSYFFLTAFFKTDVDWIDLKLLWSFEEYEQSSACVMLSVMSFQVTFFLACIFTCPAGLIMSAFIFFSLCILWKYWRP